MMIRRIPNGEIPCCENSENRCFTKILNLPYPSLRKGGIIIIDIFAKQRWETRGSETSQYPEEKKSKEIP